MSITEWLKLHKNLPIYKLRKAMLSAKEWDKLCEEYEQYCKRVYKKPRYE